MNWSVNKVVCEIFDVRVEYHSRMELLLKICDIGFNTKAKIKLSHYTPRRALREEEV
jgi:hypothetical protein